MDATINPDKGNQQSMTSDQEKSELMRFFEHQVKDIYWAYKDLLKAIFEKDEPESK